MFVLKEKKTNKILMVGTHKTVCRYYAVEREKLTATTEERRKALFRKGSPDKIFINECEHLYEIVEAPSFDKMSVSHCHSQIAKKKKEK